MIGLNGTDGMISTNWWENLNWAELSITIITIGRVYDPSRSMLNPGRITTLNNNSTIREEERLISTTK